MTRLTQAKGAVSARSADEIHRVATPLELLFDLCFVVAIAQAGREFSTAVVHDQVGHGLASYAMIFFAIWWPWMNYSWFASGFDPDDIPFRLATFAQITGALVIAAGVPRAFEHQDLTVVVIGYVIVRLAFATQLLRAHRDNPGTRAMTARWCAGLIAVQVGWVVQQLIHVHGHAFKIVLGVLVVAELAVPLWGSHSSRLPFHPRHIVERYGCFTLIVLGETVASATVAVQEATSVHGHLAVLLALALGGLLIVFAAWWVYFAYDAADLLNDDTWANFRWGYGHYLVFAAAGGIGAGIQVSVAWFVGTAPISAPVAAATVTVPSALFLAMVWLLQARYFKKGRGQAALPVTAAAILLCTFAGHFAVLSAGVCCAACVAAGVWERRRPESAPRTEA